jgi:hypothetical protein
MLRTVPRRLGRKAISFLECTPHAEQVRQRTAEAVQLPDDEHVAREDKRQRLDQTRSIILGTIGVILKQMPSINASRQ